MRRLRCERGVGACPLAASPLPRLHRPCRCRCHLAWRLGPALGARLAPLFWPREEDENLALLPCFVLYLPIARSHWRHAASRV